MRFLWAIIALLVASGAFLMLRQPAATPAPIEIPPAKNDAAKSPTATQEQAPAAVELAPSPSPAPAETTASNDKAPTSEAKPTTTNPSAAAPANSPAPSPDPLKDLADAVTKPTPQPATKPTESPAVAPSPAEKNPAEKAPEAKPEPKTETNSGPKPEPAQDPKLQSPGAPAGAPPEAKPDATKPAAPDAKANPDSKPETKPDASAPAASAPGIPVELANNKDFPSDKVIPSKAVKRDDGALLLDERFVLKGSGTKEDPYKLPWDLLVSAQEVYKPRSGLKKMPQRLTILHEKYVKITGFVAFPIAANNAKECLVMLNQWDGCCIGVPPTAFDAIEVRLKANANDKQRLSAHGTLEGRFRVDPYEDGGWVLGLYLMDDATLTID